MGCRGGKWEAGLVGDGRVLQDLTDDEKIQEKERRLESEEHELNVVGEIRNTESSITIKPNLNILEQSKINTRKNRQNA